MLSLYYFDAPMAVGCGKRIYIRDWSRLRAHSEIDYPKQYEVSQMLRRVSIWKAANQPVISIAGEPDWYGYEFSDKLDFDALMKQVRTLLGPERERL